MRSGTLLLPREVLTADQTIRHRWPARRRAVAALAEGILRGGLRLRSETRKMWAPRPRLEAYLKWKGDTDGQHFELPKG